MVVFLHQLSIHQLVVVLLHGPGPSVNVIDYNELQTKGDSLDFGDLTIKP